ncbi:MAG: L-lysine 6-transaminase, partial [Calditrichota bacterium]
LDFYSCFASSPLGFNHEKMKDGQTLDRLTQTALHNVTNSDLFTTYKAEFVQSFFALAAPQRMKHMFLVAGGSLAIENALKAAFDWKAKLNIKRGQTHHRNLQVLHLKGAFHGRSGYTLSLTNTDPVKTEHFPKFDWPRIDNPKIIFPDEGPRHEDLLKREQKALDQAQQAIYTRGDDIAACILEPIQGEGGDNHFRGEFLRALQQLCNENEIMFVLDEVQTGVGLTGKMWAFEHFGLEPDMLCFGKKTQVCGFLANDKIDIIPDNVFKVSSRINSTWGGNLVDMVRCQRYLEIIEEDDLVGNADRRGRKLLDELFSLERQFPQFLSNARGLGLMCAFDLPNREMRDKFRTMLYNEGILLLACGDRSMRFRPALIVGEEEIGRAIDIIRGTLAKI